MISRIDHVSLAVKDFKKATALFQDVLGAKPGVGFEDKNLNFYWQVFSFGDLSRFEIINPLGEKSFLDGFLKDKKAGGVHHITLETPDIDQAKEHLEKHNIPYFGFAKYGEVWKELFIHPKDAFGVLVQIAEFQPDDYLPKSDRMPKGKKWEVDKQGEKTTITFAHPGGGKVDIELSKEEIKQLTKDLSD